MSEINIKGKSSIHKKILKENKKMVPEKEIIKIDNTIIFNIKEYIYIIVDIINIIIKKNKKLI